MSLFGSILRPVLFTLDPETAHRLSILALRSGLLPLSPPVRSTRLAVNVCGLRFPNPLGMSAGYDKNAEIPDQLLRLGFGFAEIGSVTPLAQEGNPKPRIFRLVDDEAVINRLGFNNDGHDVIHERLRTRSSRKGIVGVNVGANKDSADRIADYVGGVERFSPLASYLTVNISSPNTPGLRHMQSGAALAELLARIMAARDASPRKVPVFLKIAPDLSANELEEIASEVLRHGIDGVIVSNTTLARPGLASAHAGQAGGLSGKPLFNRSTIVLARMRRLLGPDIAMIGAGGVDSAETTLEKIRAGADLVQLYTGFIYGGPGLPHRILRDLDRLVSLSGAGNISALRDTRLDAWADQALDN